MVETLNNWFESLYGTHSLTLSRDGVALWSFDFGLVISILIVGISAFLLCHLFYIAFKKVVGGVRK